MDFIWGIIVILILIAISLYLVFWFPYVVRGWIGLYKKKLAIRHIQTPESQEVLNTLDPHVLETLLRHMNGFNRKMSTYRDFMTPAFLKEAYFPETHSFDPDVTVDTMLKYFDADYPNRTGLKSYFFDSSEILPDGSIAVGVSRLYHDGETSRIRYILSKDLTTGQWSMDHISRNYTGKVVEQLESSRGTQLYAIEIDDEIQLVYESQRAIPNIQLGDSVYVDGYLVTHESLDGYYYYRLLKMHRIEPSV